LQPGDRTPPASKSPSGWESYRGESKSSGTGWFATLHARWLSGASDAIPLTRSKICIGRQPDNDIVISDPRISGAHLEIICGPDGVYLRDMKSRNGTFLDGQRLPAVQPIPVPSGAVIRLADCLELKLASPDPALPATSGFPRSVAMPAHVTLRERPSPGLIVVQRDGEVQQVPLGDAIVKIGRQPDNDLVINSPVVSGHHAEVIPQGSGHYQLVDRDSRNGILHEGRRVARKPLRPGESLFITDQVMIQFRPDLCFVTQGEAEPEAQRIDLRDKRTYRIGRAPEGNDLRLDDPRVSRYHAVIERTGATYRVQDLRSHNGTFVNGKRVEREQRLEPGDEIQIAGMKLVFSEEGLNKLDTRGGLRLDLVRLHKVVKGGKDLLQDISLSIYPREFVALVGTSGAGKSTLLDAMNGFRPASSGEVLVNRVNLYTHFDAYRTELGYVPQEDIMHRELTVYQALDYAGRLRMPADTSTQERAARIQQVLSELDLTERKDLQIQKLSGGQRKRVSIAIELLTKPQMFFLDEATSGLDPGTELELMQLLRRLTEDPKESRTIVLITHATKNVMLCDKVIFLTKGGYLAFYGAPDEALSYFDGWRSPQERLMRPDFEFDDIYNLIDPDKALPENASEQDKLALAAEWGRRYRNSPYYRQYVADRYREGQEAAQRSQALSPGTATRRRPRTSAWQQFIILSSRYWAVMRRDPKSLAILLAQAPLIGIFSFINFRKDLFNPAGGSPDKALTALFLAVIIVLLFGTVNAAREFTKEIPVYKRERMVNLKVGPYVFSKVFVAGMFCLYQVAVYLAFTLITIDWPRMAFVEWSQIYITLSLASISGVMLGLLLSALSSNDGQAVALIPVILIPQFIFAGVLMPDLAKVPVVPQIATSKWSLAALATITQADLAGSEDPEIDEQIATRRREVIELKVREEGDKAVAEQLEAKIQEELPERVKTQTDEILASETRSAQDRAEAQARREMSKQLMPVPAAEQERQVKKARDQAAREVAAKRPQIEAQVRAELEPILRREIEQGIRDEVRRRLEAEAGDATSTENPVVKGAHDHFGDIFSANIAVCWAAMTTIVLVLLGLILFLQKRKDAVK
jgi:ABC-type multidrug transport system ATPase subunit/pSer/pThr/pTyr-binding forkhead associated (FHA) protein